MQGPTTGSGGEPGRELIRILNAIAAVRSAPGDPVAVGRAHRLMVAAGLSLHEADRMMLLVLGREQKEDDFGPGNIDDI